MKYFLVVMENDLKSVRYTTHIDFKNKKEIKEYIDCRYDNYEIEWQVGNFFKIKQSHCYGIRTSKGELLK